MDYFQVGLAVYYLNKINGLKGHGRRDEDRFYELHCPQELRAWPLVSAFAVISVTVVAGLITF